MEEKNNKGSIGLIIACTILIILGGVIGGKIILDKNKEAKENNVTETNDYYKDYKYKLLYESGDVHEIYLLANNEIKPLFVTPEYEVCEGMDCMEPTGKNHYEEVSINLNEEQKNEVLNLFNKLGKNSQNKVIDTRNLKLTKEEVRILDGLILGEEDLINLSKYFIFDTESKEVKGEEGEATFKNSKTFLKNSENKIVNKIAAYLNKIVDLEFDDINELAKESHYPYDDVLGVDITTKLELDEKSYISLTITREGNMGGVNWYQKNGYVFNAITGDIVEFSNGWKNKYYEEALKEFKKDELYEVLMNEGIEPEWQDILKEEMFKTGNWYLDGENIVFLIPGTEIGFNEATCKLLEIKVKDNDWIRN